MKRERVLFFSIVILSILTRILFLDKPAGFWHNEMVMYNQTMAGNIFDIINAAVNADVHFPLYQIVLRGWIKIFGNSDIAIRMFSVTGGVLGVVAAYFTGKEIKDEKTGNFFALLSAINATYIFYSQEVKFYIFLPLFVTLSLYFIARICRKNKPTDYIGYLVCNLCIVYTFTIGVLYVIAQGISVLIYMFMKKRELIKNFIFANIALILFISPFIIFILTHMSKYKGAAWIFTNNIYTTFILLQNYFTPCLAGVYNNPVLYKPTICISSILFLFVPAAIAFYSIYKAVRYNKTAVFILLIAVLFLGFETILCMNSGLRMLTRYTIMALPPLLLLVSLGLGELKNTWTKIILIFLIVINVFYLIASPNSAVRGFRDLGEKPAADVMLEQKISSDDTIVLALRKNDFDKYLDFEGRRFSLLQDFVHEPYALNPEIQDRYDAYWDYVKDNTQINKEFEKDFYNRVIKTIKPHTKLFYIWDENYNTFPLIDYDKYREIPVMTASLSRMNADAFMICNKYLTLKGGTKLKYYRIFIFEK